jgi:hypothetical protein
MAIPDRQSISVMRSFGRERQEIVMLASASDSSIDLAQVVHKALRFRQDDLRKDGLLHELLLFQSKALGRAHEPRRVTDAILEEALARLTTRDPASASLLRLRFFDHHATDEVARRLAFAESTVFAKQSTAIRSLASVVHEMEQLAWKARETAIRDRLDAPHHVELFGIDEQVQKLAGIVGRPASPWITSIEGMGGIGKTALADLLMRHLCELPDFYDFGWLSAKPAILDLGGGIRPKLQPALSASALVNGLLHQLMPEVVGDLLATPERVLATLKVRLKAAPHLIAIDNLETVVDLEALMPTLHLLANPTKFVLTSRRRLIDERGVHVHHVPELSEPDAFALIRQEAELRKLPELADGSPEALRSIYQQVGGHPLALLLIVGQAQVRPLRKILADLHDARGKPAENLYTFIYRQSWDNLDDRDRQVLLCMPLVHVRGDSLDFITAVSGMAEDDVAQALDHLIALSLVDVAGGSDSLRYQIHSLTRTFLQEQIARWL